MVLSLKLPEELAGRLASAARRRGTTRSAVVRDALEAYLREARVSKGSAADLARDLIGKVEGPSDLASNPKHMKDFGR